MLVDAKRDPTAVLASDFNDDIPFQRDQITYSVGSHWVQKYLTRIDGVLYVLPKYWNIPARKWEPYSIWNWMEQPYNILCDGCHTVGFDPATKSFFEPGVGCEACHGPLAAHVADPATVVPQKPDPSAVCLVCHVQNLAKPKGFPQIEPTEHYGDACGACHKPHVPLPVEG
jgi:hypothetical protein